MIRWSIPLVILCCLSGWTLAEGKAAVLPARTAPVIKRASSAIAITADGVELLVVNPDSNTLSVVALDKGNAVTEIAVGVDPRTVTVDDNGRWAYVANRGSASISVVDLAARRRVAEITVGYRPYGVLVSPDGGRLFVAEQGASQIRILDTRTLATIALVPTLERPSGLAITDDSRTLYVTHLLSNALTAIALQAHVVCLPLLVKAAGTELTIPHTPSIFQILTSNFQFPATTIPLWPGSNLVQSIVIAPDGLRAWVPHTRSNSANRALTFDTTVFPVVTPVDLSAARMIPGANIALDTVDRPVGLPFDTAFTPDGRELWTVNSASNDVSVIDLSSPGQAMHITVHITVGDAPRAASWYRRMEPKFMSIIHWPARSV